MASWRNRARLSALLLVALCACSDGGDGGDGGNGGNGGPGGDGDRTPDEAQGAAGSAASDGSDTDESAEAAGDLLGPWASLAERGCPPGSVLDYDNFGGPYFLDHCQGCHGGSRAVGQRQGAPPEVSFDDIGAIRELADRIWLRAADTNATMPPVGPPTAEVRGRLGEWLACGAP